MNVASERYTGQFGKKNARCTTHVVFVAQSVMQLRRL